MEDGRRMEAGGWRSTERSDNLCFCKEPSKIRADVAAKALSSL
jgi:hypothetical protein